MSPPIRPRGHQDALWAGIKSGLIQVVATDHCPFNQKGQKEMGRADFTKIPNGAAGIENRLGLLYTAGVAEGRLDLNEMVDVFATQPAKIFGLYPRKGSIVLGGDAAPRRVRPDRRIYDQREDPSSPLRPEHLRGIQGQKGRRPTSSSTGASK